MLNGVRQQESANPTNLRSIEQYRSLCLLALGRGAEAEAAIAVVVASDPMYQPTRDRSVAARADRVLRSASAAAARHRAHALRLREGRVRSKDYLVAEQQFRELLRLIDDPDMGGRLGDLRMLVTGFVDLSAAAAAPPPEPKAEPRREEAAPAAGAGRARSAESLLVEDEGVLRRRRRSARKCRVCRCRSPIRPASAASST